MNNYDKYVSFLEEQVLCLTKTLTEGEWSPDQEVQVMIERNRLMRELYDLRASKAMRHGGNHTPDRDASDGYLSRLRPCPFCGASGDDITYGKLDADEGSRYDGFDYVQCTECGAEVRAYRGDMPPFMEAIEKWNIRIADEEI